MYAPSSLGLTDGMVTHTGWLAIRAGRRPLNSHNTSWHTQEFEGAIGLNQSAHNELNVDVPPAPGARL